MNGIGRILNLLRKETPSPGTDYTGTVTKVENGTAYVRFAGSEITDTPVALSIDAKPGDNVRVRVCNGRAWVTGNDTLPPSNDKKEVATKMSQDMSDRSKYIVIKDGIMKFLANTLCVDSKNFKLDENGNAEFSGMLKAAGGTFSGILDAVGGTFTGMVKGATYVDSTSNFTMDIGTSDQEPGMPAFKIGGYINGNPNNDYLEITISLFHNSGDLLPNMYLSGMVKDSPDAAEEHGVSIGFDDSYIHFYGSWIENGHLTRVHSSLPWGYNPY